jgi:hypothetical protein
LAVVVTEPAATTSDERPKVATGRAVRDRKRLVNECLHLDLVELRRRGVVMGPNGASITWTQQAGLGPVGAGSTGIVLLTATRPHLGGRRWWFTCPGERDGEPCGRRVRVLYMLPGDQQPGCRLCLRLTYASRQRHRAFGWEQCERPLQRNGRLMRDLLSRSRRRRFRALVAVDPEGTAAAIGCPVETVFEMRRLARGSRCG